LNETHHRRHLERAALFEADMKPRFNLTSLCLLATLFLVFGSILSMMFFAKADAPTSISVQAVAKTPTE